MPRLDPPPDDFGRVPSRRDFFFQAAAGLGAAAGLSSFLALAREEGTARPPATTARIDGPRLTLGNALVAGEWEAGPAGLHLVRLTDGRTGKSVAVGRAAFSVTLGAAVVDSSRLRLAGPPRVEELAAVRSASRRSEGIPGCRLAVDLVDEAGTLRISWRAVLRDGSSYLRQEVVVTAGAADVPLTELCLVDLALDGVLSGNTKGSPVVAGSWYFGVEHPLSTSWAAQGRVRCALSRALPLRAGQSTTVSAVFGTTPAGQPRRGVLQYVERERAHPYRPFLHYNSWYDLGYFTKFDEAGALGVIRAFGEELVVKRQVTLDGFLFDDGWDDRKLWGFHEGFPRGFTPLKEAAERYGAAPGAWLSPWGGYGTPKKERLAWAAEQGFEVQGGGLALSGPVYYARFREVCLEMVRRFGVNQFKFDGTGNASSVVPGSAFGSDFDAAIALIDDLRREKPDLYVNLTTGTYPSPFWLRWADSIWRGGEDHDFTGVGTDRQRWITYRDADTYQGVALAGSLFPLSSLMLHGLVFAKHAKRLDTDPSGDFDAEVRSYFGTGTQLQEMYVTPSLLAPAAWDRLAEAARWSRRNADVLVDTHWVGGDPARLEVYGQASWSPRLGILTLRNPSDRTQAISLDPAAVFELPERAPETYQARSPWRGSEPADGLLLRAGAKQTFTLKPFEVRTLEAAPALAVGEGSRAT
ncbi:MAG: enterotoxin [Thermoanaerobaculia bacterium]